MIFTGETELRLISTEELEKVAKLLHQTYAWKKLMGNVPSELAQSDENYSGQRKYNVDQIEIIDYVSRTDERTPARIFLDEWTTSGEKRPTLSHLLELLIKCELFRAADYVAEELLLDKKPERPNHGPAARVDISFPLQDDCVGVTSTCEIHTSGINVSNSNHSVTVSESQSSSNTSPFDTNVFARR